MAVKALRIDTSNETLGNSSIDYDLNVVSSLSNKSNKHTGINVATVITPDYKVKVQDYDRTPSPRKDTLLITQK